MSLQGNRQTRWLLIMFLAGAFPPALLAQETNSRPDANAAATIGKKGAALSTDKQSSKTWKRSVKLLNVDWHYSWGPMLPEDEVPDVQFVPMIWNCREVNRKYADLVTGTALYARKLKSPVILGFNEPDQAEQANMTVEQAIAAWPELLKTKLRLGSPAAANAEGEWLRHFLAKTKALNYRVDFICVHWYGNANAQSFLQRLEKIHDLYGKQIWITEFAPADWNAKTLSENKVTPEQALNFMKEVLPALDQLDYVERYAWFTSTPDNPNLGSSALFNKDRTLTELGKVYAAHKSLRDKLDR